MIQHSDFRIGLEFRYREQLWRCTDVGTRTITAICLSEVWVTRAKANTNVKERVRVTSFDSKRFTGPPYGVPEQVFGESTFAACVPESDWQEARRILGLSVSSRSVP